MHHPLFSIVYTVYGVWITVCAIPGSQFVCVCVYVSSIVNSYLRCVRVYHPQVSTFVSVYVYVPSLVILSSHWCACVCTIPKSQLSFSVIVYL